MVRKLYDCGQAPVILLHLFITELITKPGLELFPGPAEDLDIRAPEEIDRLFLVTHIKDRGPYTLGPLRPQAGPPFFRELVHYRPLKIICVLELIHEQVVGLFIKGIKDICPFGVFGQHSVREIFEVAKIEYAFRLFSGCILIEAYTEDIFYPPGPLDELFDLLLSPVDMHLLGPTPVIGDVLQ